jgi:hypothetical protein
MGPQFAPSESSARPLPVPTMLIPFGAEFLIESIVVVILDTLLEILRGLTLMHPSWSLGSGIVWWYPALVPGV